MASLDTEDSDKAVASKTQHVDKSYAKKLQTGILQSKATRKAEALRLRHQKQPMAMPASTQSIIGGKFKYAADTGQSVKFAMGFRSLPLLAQLVTPSLKMMMIPCCDSIYQ